MAISDGLFYGKDNALSSTQLCKMLGLTVRELQTAVEQERRSGAAICAYCGADGKQGYYLAKDKEELLDYCETLKRRAQKIFTTRQYCLKTAERLPSRQEERGADR